MYYTYLYIDPRNNLPFYIGKGKNDRSVKHLWYAKKGTSINKHLENKIKQIWKDDLEPVIRVIPQHDETMALLWEEKTIRNCKRWGIKLCNLTTGGDNGTYTDDVKNKISNALKGHSVSIETRKKQSDARKGKSPANKGKKTPPEIVEAHRQKILGRKHSDETKIKMSKSQKGRKMSPESIEKRLMKMVGYKHSEKTKEKMSANHADLSGEKHPMYGKHHTKESIDKMKKSHTGVPLSEERRKNMKGRIPWNKGLRKNVSGKYE